MLLITLFVLAPLTAGCASGTQGAARSETGGAESILSQAQDSHVRQYASLELRLSEDKLARANQAYGDDDYQKAQFLASEAMADAKLAQARAKNTNTKQMVQKLRESIDQLHREIENNNTEP